MAKKVTIKTLDYQKNSDDVLYCTWSFTQEHVDYYRVYWQYVTGDGVWFVGQDNQVTYKQDTYSIPSNATKVRVKIKPVSTTYTKNDKETHYWTGDWCSYKTYSITKNQPDTPSVPTVKIEDYTLTASLNNITGTATKIEFRVYKADKTLYKTLTSTVTKAAASVSCTVTAGYEYKVRARGYNGNTKEYGAFSEYSDDVGTAPKASSGITKLNATSSTSVYVQWKSVSTATSYTLQYATSKTALTKNSDQCVEDSNITEHYRTLEGLESGYEYFFRVKAVNDDGESAWTDIASVILGKAPSAPTTWSSTTTVMVGEELILYWVHNSADGSSQTYAEIELTIDGTVTTLTKQNSTDEDEKDLTSYYSVSTSGYTEGTTILWRVRTRGVTDEYGDWSVQRTVNVYAPATLELSAITADGSFIDTLESFPFYISGEAGPSTQNPIGYYVSIAAGEGYETLDSVGNDKLVSAGDEVYSKYFDTTEDLMIEMSAGNIDLENGITYVITVTVTMNTGLTATESYEFDVSWEDETYDLDAELSYDENTYTLSICPYAEEVPVVLYLVQKDSSGNYTVTTTVSSVTELNEDEAVDGAFIEDGTQVYSHNGSLYCEGAGDAILADDVTLSVYRREFNGEFTELITGIENTQTINVTDPHPALDYARYRIVGISSSTGAVSYYDLPGYPIGEVAVIIQWDEKWTTFDVYGEEDALAEQPWSGSLLRLPYNIDVSDQNDPDVSLIDYIGRERPVSYYGTHVNETATWNMDVPKSDRDTLYALRRLSIYMGDVYVREPSGSGYWASIKVSFSQKHTDLVIPVTLDITRVEGDA